MENIQKPHFDRIYTYRVISLIHHFGTITKTAEYLGVSVSSVTKDLQKLEDYLETKLFIRTTRSLSLTHEGKVLLEKGENLFTQVLDLESEIKDETQISRGKIKVTAPVSLGEHFITEILTQFQALHPYIELDIILTDQILDPIENGIDISIRTAHKLQDSFFFAKEVGIVKRGLFASPNYLNHFPRIQKPQTLLEHNCLIYQRANAPLRWNLKKKKNLELNIKGNFRSNNLNTIMKACENGIGIANLPLYLLRYTEKEILQVLKTYELPSQSIFIITPHRPSTLRRIQKLVSFIENHFADSEFF